MTAARVRALEAWMCEHIHVPQPELGGLTLAELYDLLHGDWATRGVLRVRELPAEEVIAQPFVADARTILQHVADGGTIDETPAGLLTPNVVAELQPRVRSTLQIAGLLAQYNGSHTGSHTGLYVSRQGRALLAPEKAGQLHALLFRSFFLGFDLSTISPGDPQPGLQATIAYTLYRLYEAVPPRWWLAESLSEWAWLDCVKDPPRSRAIPGGDLSYMTFLHRVLEPLVYFGLMEERVPDGYPWKLHAEYRVTPLYARALAFEFSEDAETPFELMLER